MDDSDEKGGAPTGGTPPPGGSGQPTRPRKDARQWAALAHVAVASALVLPVIGGWVGPLVVRLTKGKTSEFVDDNALEALNFGILLSAAQLVVAVIGGVVSGGAALGGVGIGSLTKTLSLLPLVVTVAALVLPALAALKANDGKPGRYPDFLPRLITEGDDEDEADE